LFWDEGVSAVGNPDLEPERLEESSASIRLTLPVLGELTAEAIYQHSAYRGLIYWRQVQINKFKPFNLSGSVIFTRTLNVRWTLQPLNMTLNYSNVDQKSKDRSWIRTRHNHQLTYRPRFTQHLSLRHSSRHLDVHYRLRHVSKRFIRAENTKSLDGYTVADFMTALKQDFSWFAVRIQYDIENITSAEYELMERYPNPGQLWSIYARLVFKLDVKL
jgi:outer membrane cobalamin receptor